MAESPTESVVTEPGAEADNTFELTIEVSLTEDSECYIHPHPSGGNVILQYDEAQCHKFERPMGTGAFVATGDSVDTGLICSRGRAIAIRVRDEPDSSEWQQRAWWDFRCSDGSILEMYVWEPRRTSALTYGQLVDEGDKWELHGSADPATDRYEDLTGEGTRTWFFSDDERVIFTGTITRG